MRCAKETLFSDTGAVIGDLAGLADIQELNGKIDLKDRTDRFLLDDVATRMKATRTVVLRIVDKLVTLRKKALWALHFRACNMTDPVMVAAYKQAFGAGAVTYHECRLLFLEFVPAQVIPGNAVADFPSEKHTADGKGRQRSWTDPLGLLSDILLGISDIDGHVNVTSMSLMDTWSTDDIHEWATFLVRRWREPAPGAFVMPVMWKDRTKDMRDDEVTFHCPLEEGWRLQLKML